MVGKILLAKMASCRASEDLNKGQTLPNTLLILPHNVIA